MRAPLALLLPFAIAACGSPAGNQSAPANGTAGNQAAAQTQIDGAAPAQAQAAPALASDVRLQAGQWEMTALLRSVDAPGVPAQQQAMLRRQLGQPIANRVCITEAQARDLGRFATPGGAAGCSMPERVYAGGVIRMRISCPVPGGRPGAIRIATQGRYTPTTLDMSMNQEVPSPNGGVMRMSATMTGRRIGACPAGGVPPTRIRPPSVQVPVVAAPPAPR